MATNPYVNKVIKSDGTTIIDISDSTVTAANMAQGVTAYDATGEKITGTGQINNRIVYGIRINLNESDPTAAVTYLEDAVGMTPAYMDNTNRVFNYGSWENAFFMPKPCMLKFDGTVDYYLDPNDYTKKEDGTASDVANTAYSGNAMMEFPKIYVKVTKGTNYIDIYISNKMDDDGTFKYFSNIDRNDRTIEHFYVGIYMGCYISDKLRSLSGQSTYLNKTVSGSTYTSSFDDTLMAAYYNNNTYDYSIDILSDRTLLTYLLYLMGKSLDIKSKFGYFGLYQNISTTGGLNDKGLFYSDYGWRNSSGRVKIFGIEDFINSNYAYLAGLVKYKNQTNVFLYRLTSGGNGYLYPYSYTSSTYSYPDSGSSGYIRDMNVENSYLLLPTTFTGSSSTYFCSYGGTGAYYQTQYNYMLYTLGRPISGAQTTYSPQYLFFYGTNRSDSARNSGGYGAESARLSCKPART